MLRETLFAYLLGSGPAADAFFAATRIPNLLRDLFAEGALGAAFVPVISEKLASHDAEEAFGVVRRMMVAMALIVGIAVALGVIFAPFLVKSLAPGFAAIPVALCGPLPVLERHASGVGRLRTDFGSRLRRASYACRRRAR